jgi:hypothetical protein
MRRVAIILLAMVAAWPVAGLLPSASAAPRPVLRPAVSASRSGVTPGQLIVVTGRDFRPLERVSVSVCGDRGLIGSAGCDLGSQAALIADGTGAFTVQIHARIPPASCPCVIEVDGERQTYRLPLAIRGAPSAPLQTPPKMLMPHLTVADVHLASGSNVASWFGLPSTGTLSFTLVNNGFAPAQTPTLVLDLQTRLGQVTVGTPGLGDIAAGQRRTYHVAVPLHPLTSGRVVVRGGVQLPLSQSTLEGSTLVVPWGWLALLLATPAALILRRQHRPHGRHRRVRHNHRRRVRPGMRPQAPKAVSPLFIPAQWASEAAVTAAALAGINLSPASATISAKWEAEPARCG